MNINAYLNRIHFTGALKPDLETLTALQYKHAFVIPFEDIDIQLGIPLHLHPERLYEKIVMRKRGGYCYELNALFYELLRDIGFDAYLISGRITKGNKLGPEYDHLAIIVNLDDKKWLVDVGYGDFSLKPLLIECNEIQPDGMQHYLVKKGNSVYYSVGKYKSYDGKFHSEYQFSLQPRSLSEFKHAHQHKQISPDSHFTQNLICTLPTANGRISLINQRLIQTVYGLKTDTIIEANEIPNVLNTHFGIELSGDTQKLHWKFKQHENVLVSEQ